MLYLAGDNNLTEDMVLALQDLQAEGPLGEDKIVAQLDPSAPGLATQRYEFIEFNRTNGKPKQYIYEFRTEDLVEASTGNKQSLIDFVKWTVGKYGGNAVEKNRYLLILSGHGSGITEDFFLSDTDSMGSLTIGELRDALDEIKKLIGKKIDILGMDACHMAMGEIAYEIRNHVDVLVGAEGLEPEFGWPYRRILAKAKEFRTNNPTESMNPEQLATTIVTEYVEHYSDYDRAAGRSADLAAIRLNPAQNAPPTKSGTIDDVVKAVTELYDALPKYGEKEKHKRLVLAHWYAQTYKADQFVDLRDFCEQIQEVYPDASPGLFQASAKVVQKIKECIIQSGCSGYASQFSYGFSVYLPWGIVTPDYAETQFAKTTHWDKFLEAHVSETRRPSRFPDQGLLPVPQPGKDPEAVKQQRLTKLNQLNARTNETSLKSVGSTGQQVAKGVLALSRTDSVEQQAKKAEESIVMAISTLKRRPIVQTDRSIAQRIDKAILAIATSDIPAEDVQGEIARRAMHGTASARSRYAEHGRYARARPIR